MPDCKDIKIFRRSTRTYELYFKKNGAGTDITGWTIYFTVKQNMKDTDANAIISKIITSHTDAENGKTQIDLAATDTDRMGTFYYSIDYKDDEGNEGVLFYGRIRFVESVRDTRS